jgi:hypothetical protein
MVSVSVCERFSNLVSMRYSFCWSVVTITWFHTPCLPLLLLLPTLLHFFFLNNGYGSLVFMNFLLCIQEVTDLTCAWAYLSLLRFLPVRPCRVWNNNWNYVLTILFPVLFNWAFPVILYCTLLYSYLCCGRCVPIPYGFLLLCLFAFSSFSCSLPPSSPSQPLFTTFLLFSSSSSFFSSVFWQRIVRSEYKF